MYIVLHTCPKFYVRNQRNGTRNGCIPTCKFHRCQDVLYCRRIRRRDVPSSTLKTQVREPREVSPWVIGAADSKTRPVPAVAVTSSSVHIAIYTVNESWEEVKRRQGREDESGGV